MCTNTYKDEKSRKSKNIKIWEKNFEASSLNFAILNFVILNLAVSKSLLRNLQFSHYMRF